MTHWRCGWRANRSVLLKNDGLLPLDRTKIHKIAVLGFNANYTETLLGNYKGEPSHPVTFAARHR